MGELWYLVEKIVVLPTYPKYLVETDEGNNGSKASHVGFDERSLHPSCHQEEHYQGGV